MDRLNVACGFLSLLLVRAALIQRKYWLSAKACAGILTRAARRGKVLPERLERALRAVSGAAPPTLTTPDAIPCSPLADTDRAM